MRLILILAAAAMLSGCQRITIKSPSGWEYTSWNNDKSIVIERTAPDGSHIKIDYSTERNDAVMWDTIGKLVDKVGG